MAVDTRNKRASIIGLGLAFRLVLPASDGAIDQADRQHLAYSYAGILAAGVVGPGKICVAGDYRPTVFVTGDYRSTVSVAGDWSDC